MSCLYHSVVEGNTCGKSKKGLWFFRIDISMNNLVCIIYIFVSLNFYFWLGDDGEIIRYVFCRVLLSKSK